MLSLTAALVFLFSVALKGFLAIGNIENLLFNVSLLGILAVGMGVVVIGRGVDLSQIAIMGTSAALVLSLLNGGTPLPWALLLSALLALAMGAFNGIMVAFVEIPALFATLATGILFFGFGMVFLLDGAVQYLPAKQQGLAQLAQGTLLGVPYPALIFIGLMAAVQLWLNRTALGFLVYAQGDNAEAARLSGAPVRPLTVLTYMISGAIACLAGLIFATASAAIDMRVVQSTMIFDVILVVVLGGISLVGGRGSMWSVLAGALLIATLLDGMVILDVNSDVQDVIKGFVLVGAVLLDRALHRVDEETAKQGDTL
ncbi:ABC transporter permease [Marinibaculum pumilum]|uniref:ABC transporter permease n=1 Tax=Marinibaculum pumilum TaxID=1766165 RepID=A0ABV7KZ12_9PROT